MPPPDGATSVDITRSADADPGTETVLTVDGRVDTTTAPQLSTCLHRELDRRPQRLIVDLTAAIFDGPAGLRVLDCAHLRALSLGVRLQPVGNPTMHPQPAPLAPPSPLAPPTTLPSQRLIRRHHQFSPTEPERHTSEQHDGTS
jgi:anti-anti-sigma regulatory factor